MKIRTALSLAGLMLIAGNLFAQARPGDDTTPGAQRQPIERATRSLKVPVILDGVEFPAGYVLPDQALTFVLEKGVVHVFTSAKVADEYMRQGKLKMAAAMKGGGVSANSYPYCDWPQDYSWFNKNPGCGGSGSITLAEPDEYGELDSIGWNNSISCVKAACIPDYTVLYSCRYFINYYISNYCNDPDRLAIAGGDIYSDLNNYGFNNRTSSIRFE
jgi:hypothetical protein